MKPYTTPGRTLLPLLCWVKEPGTATRCTLRPHSRGDHYHAYRRTPWRHRMPEPQ
ncbi:hypothetical protein ACH492_01475 [Streptomyces sp. NPDC019443]|uniref:hypothetical protein n=1 Tax=Streptomyces sp. NPDC019443 TaxID=3365061 RepID=UPI003797F6C0